MYVSYSDMPHLLVNQRPFSGNSVTATINQWLGGYEYKVYSYSTVIYSVTVTDGEKKVYFDNTNFSPTTSKMQNMLIRTLHLNIPTKRDNKIYNL